MRKGIIINELNKLTFNYFRDNLMPEYDVISILWTKENEQLLQKVLLLSPSKINIRGSLDHEFFRFCNVVRPKSVTIEGSGDYRLEYSFGLDVLKYKGLLMEFLGSIGCEGCHGVCTDFRHENVLHSGDAGASFVEMEVRDYDANRDYYRDAIEVAAMRDMKVRVSGDTSSIIGDLGDSAIDLVYENIQ
ncbi:MAG: hypothetical protein MJZ61_09390 [Bacteroidales bacterium]|nr:hypothetical protein [Bacteroidales bacterium]